ncbi:hypothetical protein [Gordonia sp. i37]|uniref:hypothetical protein n=1 Tax=Gordonia sp. i37 TaxID=1961707 RepID=UPI0009AC79BE|nr:hypothetical protein [Gordonia sp. i37]OPX16002.1 hypothetical protein B1964_07040 [Gordonia sp. i37]
MRLLHVCESCDRREILTPDQAFDMGWDYAPMVYPFGLVTPRLCPECDISKSTWWALYVDGIPQEGLTDRQHETIRRIAAEPESIMVDLDENDRSTSDE